MAVLIVALHAEVKVLALRAVVPRFHVRFAVVARIHKPGNKGKCEAQRLLCTGKG